MSGDRAARPGGETVPRVSSWVRCVLWDQILRRAAGGVGVDGDEPSGPVVAVANHSSRADTAALIAALGRQAPALALAALLAPWWRTHAVVAALIGLGGVLTAVLRLRAGARHLAAAAAGTEAVQP